MKTVLIEPDYFFNVEKIMLSLFLGIPSLEYLLFLLNKSLQAVKSWFPTPIPIILRGRWLLIINAFVSAL